MKQNSPAAYNENTQVNGLFRNSCCGKFAEGLNKEQNETMN